MRTNFGQLMMIGISGKSLTSEEKNFIIENNISGVTLFGRNIESPEQVHALCSEIQSLRHKMPDKAPLFIGIDMEGGRVARLKAPFTVWPPMSMLGVVDNPTLSFHVSHCMGQELKAFGINLDFSPCVDVLTNPLNKVIGDRSISSDPEMVAKHASALVRGFLKAEVIACAKHFPGHGNTLIDSHEDLPVEESDFTRLEKIELIPFKRAFKARIDMVMTSHIRFPKIDPKWPATLSEIFIKKMIRQDCRFRGLVISDDLGMKAMTKHFPVEEIPVRAVEAGVEILLYCNEFDVPPIAMESLITATAQGRLKREEIDATAAKILKFKKDLITHPDPLSLSEAISVINNPQHKLIAESLKAGVAPEVMPPL